MRCEGPGGQGAHFHLRKIPIFIYFGRPIPSNLEAALIS